MYGELEEKVLIRNLESIEDDDDDDYDDEENESLTGSESEDDETNSSDEEPEMLKDEIQSECTDDDDEEAIDREKNDGDDKLLYNIEEFQTSTDVESQSSLLDEQLDILQNKQLIERIESLKTSITDLKQQLGNERRLYSEDIENLKQFHARDNESCYCNCHHDSETMSVNSSITPKSYDEYKEQPRNVYTPKHVSLIDYQSKIYEVESMCNMELLKIKQNLQYLEPLQMMASSWTTDFTTNF